jgi:general secretion pathway protein A
VYEEYYGFWEKPFNLTPDPKFLYLSQRHTEAFAHLEFGRRERGGFAVITGEVGTGKTTLARYFLSRLGPGTASAVVLYPALSAAELLRCLLDDLKLQVPAEASLKDLVDALHRYLLDARRLGHEVVLLIDEAQDLTSEVLEQVRLLSNLETDTEKLLQIVLIGQTELREMLARRELRQLAQRVTARYHLVPLSRAETGEYIRHRLGVAGGEGKVFFTGPALASVHRHSGGIPRLINLICDRSLLGGYARGRRVIDSELVNRAAAEVLGEEAPRRGRLRYALAGAGALAAAAVAGLWLTGSVPATSAVAPTATPAPSVAAPASLVAAAAPAAKPAARRPAPRPDVDAGALDEVVLELDREASLAEALADVQALWGNTVRLERTAFRTHLGLVRRLDLPVVLELAHPARRDTCHVALLRLDDQVALLGAGSRRLRVPTDEIEQLWTRQAIFPWRDFDGVLGRGERASSWARDALVRDGLLAAGEDLATAVARYQRSIDLLPDGVVGSRTLLALYSLGSYPRPRLGGQP